MSAGNNTKGREKLSDTEVKLTYSLTEKQRQEVNAVRNKYRNRIIRNNSLNVHTLLICNEEQKEVIEADILEADIEMKRLAAKIQKEIEDSILNASEDPWSPEILALLADINVPDLHARVKFFPLDAGEISKGQLYEDISNEIKAKVFSVTLERINPLLDLGGKNLPSRTLATLKKLRERLIAVNILDDPDVNQSIKRIDLLVEQESFKPLKEFVEGEMGKLDMFRPISGRAAVVEI
jgi:hypothetical protein